MSLPGFDDFYQAVHGYSPFPWQCRAAERLASRNTFAVTVPTGLGKSSLVDAAVWAAAHGTWRRIVFVVDRRLVVDEVHERAQLIMQCLQESQDSRLQELRARLGEMQVVRLRGGVFGDDEWVLYPERLTIVLTTVDQLGSRLLFRGYGVSPKRWPMHAGFFSEDTLVVVDEAHLSTPFLQTLTALKEAGADVALIPMSATLKGDWAEEALGLDEHDHALDVVKQRLNASKRVRIQEVGSSDKDLVKAALAALDDMRTQPEVRKVALVVNRVSTARALFEQIRARKIDCTLLTGRIRPFERDQQVGEVLTEVKAGRSRCAEDKFFVVVATQTIEVGADFDFDALISECAPLSSLRQRFGRLDRLGQLGQAQGWILRRTGQKADPVYGESLSSAWEWLAARAAEAEGIVDFGLTAFSQLLAAAPAPVEDERHAATLLPTHVHTLSQTGPYAPQVDLTAWLHGPSNQAADAILVWRDDLDALAPEDWPAAVSLLPPMLREGLPLSVQVARRFLNGEKTGDALSDINGSDVDDKKGSGDGRPVLRWRGSDDCCVIAPEEIRPGDTLILPASYGGCDSWGWAPDSSQSVHDLADACQLEKQAAGAAQRFTLRLAEGHWRALGSASMALRVQTRALLQLQRQMQEEEAELDDALDEARLNLLDLLEQLPDGLKGALQDPEIEPHPGGLVIRGKGTEDVEDLIETGRPISLVQHHHDVARWADSLSPGHPDCEELVAAAAVHDAGKAEARMQNLLHGHPLRASLGPVLAKSALRSQAQQRMAYRQSGLPHGFRHEFASLDFEQIEDPLVRHLVATHHGHGRPWLRGCSDPAAPGARFATLSAHWLEHWSQAVQQHGPWRLAQLEWRLRAADARASMEEALQTEDTP